MIPRTKLNRLGRVSQAHAEMPLRTHVVREAFDDFRMFGELPDDDRLADAVARAALNGGRIETVTRERSELERILSTPLPPRVQIEVVTSTPNQAAVKVGEVREGLFQEAVHETGFARTTARCAIALLVAQGGDVCDPMFGADRGVPKYGTLGMRVMGWPERFAVRPYVAQAHRLFARLDALRDRIDYRDPDWFVPIEKATLRLWDDGELPENELIRDLVLADEEFELLVRHKRGHDVAVQMAAFDRVAKAKGAKRDAAVQALVRLLHPTRSAEETS